MYNSANNYCRETAFIPSLTTPGTLVSIGYGGRRPASLVTLLQEHGVGLLVDVRQSPLTRIPGFSGTALANTLARVGIEYKHEVRLGNPPENRDVFHDGKAVEGKARFRKIMGGPGRRALQEIIVEASRRPVAILCAERDVHRCHRQAILDDARKLNPAIEVKYLG